MVVTVAGEKKTYDESLTIAKLIEVEKVENPDYVTVTVNDEFVESTDFATTALKENDVVDLHGVEHGEKPHKEVQEAEAVSDAVPYA